MAVPAKQEKLSWSLPGNIWGANCFFNTLVLKFIIYHLAQLGKKLAMKLYAHSVQCVWARKRKSYALRIHPRREFVSLAEKTLPLPPARLELGTFEDKSSQPQLNVMLMTGVFELLRKSVWPLIANLAWRWRSWMGDC